MDEPTSQKNRKKGVTLLECLAIMSIIMMVALFLTVRVKDFTSQNKERREREAFYSHIVDISTFAATHHRGAYAVFSPSKGGCIVTSSCFGKKIYEGVFIPKKRTIEFGKLSSGEEEPLVFKSGDTTYYLGIGGFKKPFLTKND